ncbi:MAG: hypothetical protein ACFFFC_17375, partial [Candidatus Thorarchaeota archaeon]
MLSLVDFLWAKSIISSAVMIVGIFTKGFNHFISDYHFLKATVRTKGTGQNVLNRTFLTLIWDVSPDGGLVLMSLPTGATVVGIKC